jgi:hypothetical protein
MIDPFHNRLNRCIGLLFCAKAILASQTLVLDRLYYRTG